MATEPQHDGQPAAPAAPDTAAPDTTTRDTTVPGQPPAGTRLPQHTLKRTRISGVWAAVACFAVVLLLLLIFILQNSRTVEVSYFGAHGHLPLGVALLLAAIAGVLLIALPGGARILQLRATARRHRHADARLPGTAQAPSPATPSDRA